MLIAVFLCMCNVNLGLERELSLSQNVDAVGEPSSNIRTGHHTRILILCFVHSKLSFLVLYQDPLALKEEDGGCE